MIKQKKQTRYLKTHDKETLFQMLLNQHCNEKMNFNDGSCCKKSDQPTSLQLITFALFGGWWALFTSMPVLSNQNVTVATFATIERNML